MIFVYNVKPNRKNKSHFFFTLFGHPIVINIGYLFVFFCHVWHFSYTPLRWLAPLYLHIFHPMIFPNHALLLPFLSTRQALVFFLLSFLISLLSSSPASRFSLFNPLLFLLGGGGGLFTFDCSSSIYLNCSLASLRMHQICAFLVVVESRLKYREWQPSYLSSDIIRFNSLELPTNVNIVCKWFGLRRFIVFNQHP